jgi:methionyl-tRNA formyltransferase
MTEPVVFFGSGPVAAEALRRLAAWAPIEAVITKPQPPHHKEIFPVIAVCQELGLPMLTVSTRKELSELFGRRQFTSQAGVVIDFGIIIAQDVIDAFEYGIVNSHFSLLPRWRGADPITFSILEGDTETGVSLMLIVPELDAGPLLAQRSLPLPADITTPVLTEQLIALSDALLRETLPAYLAGSVQPREQPAEGITFSRKLDKSDGQLDWSESATVLERQIRAFIGWPKSRANLGGHDVVITAAHSTSGSGTPGSLWLQDHRLGVYTGEGVLVIDQLIPAGKKAMSGSDFLLGYRLSN